MSQAMLSWDLNLGANYEHENPPCKGQTKLWDGWMESDSAGDDQRRLLENSLYFYSIFRCRNVFEMRCLDSEQDGEKSGGAKAKRTGALDSWHSRGCSAWHAPCLDLCPTAHWETGNPWPSAPPPNPSSSAALNPMAGKLLRKIVEQ